MPSHQVESPTEGKLKIIGVQADSINGQKQSFDGEDVKDRIDSNEKDDVNEIHHNKTTSDKSDTCLDENSTKRLHPFVHWAQSQTHISLRVDLSQAEDLKVCVKNAESLEFYAKGRGAQGLQEYYFSLEFYSQVDNEVVNSKIERYVLVLIKKSQQVSWPRLTKHSIRLPWLRVDFDRYDDSGDSDANEDNSDSDGDINKRSKQFSQRKSYQSNVNTGDEPDEQQHSSILRGSSLDSPFKDSRLYKKNFDIFNPFNKRINKNKAAANMKYDHRKEATTMDNSKNTVRNALDYKKTYLFLYNLVLFILFLKVFIVLVIKGLNGTIDDDIVQGTAFIVKLLTYTQLLETVHPMLGLVPGGPFMPFTQSIGRLLVNYFLSEPIIRLDSGPYAHYLFTVWSAIEIFRYSFYALRVFKVEIYALKWCRYTLFLPLYPMGGLFESMVLLSTIKHYEKTGEYSISLPNAVNASFNLPWALRVYIFVFLGPTIYMLMKYMWSQRRKQLKEKLV